MNTLLVRIVSLLIVGAFWSNSASAQFPLPGFSGVFPGGGRAGAVAAIAGLVVVLIVQAHEASEQQKRIANERARRAYLRMSAQRRASLKAKRVRYIAVDTQRSAKASPQSKKSVMVWDTQSQTIAGSQVYDVKTSPKVGETAKFDRYSAEYVGSGT